MTKSISTSWFVVIFTTANIVLYHYPLALFSLVNLDYSTLNGLCTLLTLIVIIFTVSFVLLLSIALVSKQLLKLFCAIVTIGNAIAFYFIVTYQVILDKSMMGNILNTRSIESLEFLHPKLAVYIFILGFIPAFLILKLCVHNVKRRKTLKQIVMAIGLCFTMIYVNGSTALWFDQHSRKLGGVMLPWSYIINTARVYADQSNDNVLTALLPSPTSRTKEKSLVVLIIGETARASNFSLYGYERNTNPLLSSSDAIALQNTTACASYTTASIQCMLSHTGSPRASFEPLTSYLQRHQVEVIWRTNNWGDPPMVVEQYIKSSELRALCISQHCEHDEVLLTGLVERIHAASADKVLVVLHTKGSHGPSYYKRYPEQFANFKPVCQSVELDKCSDSELINAYDNTIVYTDFLINQTIAQLEKLTNRASVMMYISDHGESLGEYGLYLHGTPKAIAPAVQIEIPFIVWMSKTFKKLNKIGPSHFTQASYSHDNVFHSVMGALGISSAVYDESLDIFNRVN